MRTYLLLLLLPLAATACTDGGLSNPNLQTPAKIQCGGLANLKCPLAGQICVDDPSDTCDVNHGGADCARVCIMPSDPKTIACSALTDQASCSARTDCAVSGCPLCQQKLSFSACYNRGSSPPVISCPAIACATACGAHDEASCAKDTTCYPVYADSGLACDCDGIGCCYTFSYCAEGPAYCFPVGVDHPTPSCPSIEPCGNGRTPVYDFGSSCPSGCTNSTLCLSPDGE